MRTIAASKTFVAGAMLVSAAHANAGFTFYNDRWAWLDNVGDYQNVDLSGLEHEYISSFELPFPWTGATAYLNYPVERRLVTDGWQNPTYVLGTENMRVLTIIFDFTPCEYDPVTCNRDVNSAPPKGLGAFGFEMQTDEGHHEAGVTMMTASHREIGFFAGVYETPKFYGWIPDEPVLWLTVSCDYCDFTIGRMVQDVPEPATLPLLGAGLLGAMYGRRRAQGESDAVVAEIDSVPGTGIS